MSAKELRYSNNIANNLFFVKQLDSLCLDRRYMGYYMLIDILHVMINEGKVITSFSKQLYPYVAKKYDKTECTVERNIRSLIEKNWTVELMIKLNLMLPNGKKPKCQDFIYAVKNYIVKQIF